MNRNTDMMKSSYKKKSADASAVRDAGQDVASGSMNGVIRRKENAVAEVGNSRDASYRRIVTGVDRPMLIIILVLLAIGSVMVFSASYVYAGSSRKSNFDSLYYIKRQMVFAALGIIVMLITSRLPYTVFRKYSLLIYGVVVVLLVVVLFIGVSEGEAQRWLPLGGLTFQPSELMKFAAVFVLASYFATNDSRKARSRSSRRDLIYDGIIPLSIIGVSAGLVILEHHLSCTIIIALIGLSVLLGEGLNRKLWNFYIPVATVAIAAIVTFVLLRGGYESERFQIWLNPEAYPLGDGWQTIQGLYAIGSGGLLGVGLGNSRLKYNYVSMPHNDFIFSIVCEELGFVGAIFVMALFGILVWRGFVIAMRAPDKFSSLTALGITCKVAIQVLLNIAVVTNTMPNTGISLPFFSYGGTALVILMFEMGVLLSISRHSYQKK